MASLFLFELSTVNSTPTAKPLAGRVALVTGAAKRVGRAVALELAGAGAGIVVHYGRSQQAAEATADDIRHLGVPAATVQGDLADPAAWPRIVAEAVAALARLDILVNNASSFPADDSDTLEAFDADRWAHMLQINLTAPAGLVHAARVHLAASGEGCVINFCDIAAERPWSDHLAYCASKAGLVALTKSLARALAPDVRVNGISPGIAIFPESYDDALRSKLIARVPLQRAGKPEDMARTARFLAVDAPFITGQIIHVDGGRSAV